jgi:predicted porin
MVTQCIRVARLSPPGFAFVTRLLVVFSLLTLLDATPARAAEPITLSLGGRLREYFYVADQKSAPGEKLSTTGMMNDIRVSFQGRTVLDNGITVKALVRIYAVNRIDRTFDEAYVEVNTGVGKFRLGETEGVNGRILGDAVPEALLTRDEEVLLQALVPRTGITVFDAFSFRRFTGNAAGVAYESPEIAGFKVGVAYHPQLDRPYGYAAPIPGFPNTPPLDNNFLAHNAVDVSAAYSGDYPGGTYRVGVGYFHSSRGTFSGPSFIEAATAVNMVAGITYGGWEVSGGYIDVAPASGLDEQSWTVGALYGIGPFRISADFMRSSREAVRSGAIREHLDRETLQGAYKIAPGVTFGVAGFRAQQTDATGLTWDGAGFLSGLKLVF